MPTALTMPDRTLHEVIDANDGWLFKHTRALEAFIASDEYVRIPGLREGAVDWAPSYQSLHDDYIPPRDHRP